MSAPTATATSDKTANADSQAPPAQLQSFHISRCAHSKPHDDPQHGQAPCGDVEYDLHSVASSSKPNSSRAKVLGVESVAGASKRAVLVHGRRCIGTPWLSSNFSPVMVGIVAVLPVEVNALLPKLQPTRSHPSWTTPASRNGYFSNQTSCRTRVRGGLARSVHKPMSMIHVSRSFPRKTINSYRPADNKFFASLESEIRRFS